MMWNRSSTSWNIGDEVNDRASGGTMAANGTQARRPRRPADLDGRAGRRAAHLRRPPGGLRPAEVHDLAAAHRPRAHRAARARRRRRLRRRPPVLAVRRPARPVGGAGPARPPGAGDASASETHETVNLASVRGDRVVQVAQVDSRYLLGTRDWTAGRRPRPLLLARQGVLRLGRRCRLPDGPLERPSPARPSPTAAALRARRHAAPASAATRSPSTSSRSGSPASPSPCAAPAATWSPHSASRGRRRRLEGRLDEVGRNLIDPRR